MPTKIVGLSALAIKLRNIADIPPSDLRDALRLGAAHIVNQAKQNAPVVTGQLRRSIRSSVTLSGREAEARIGSNLEYARRIEFGFVGPDKLGRRFNQAARPYLRPAVFSQRDRALREIRELVGRSIKRKL